MRRIVREDRTCALSSHGRYCLVVCGIVYGVFSAGADRGAEGAMIQVARVVRRWKAKGSVAAGEDADALRGLGWSAMK